MTEVLAVLAVGAGCVVWYLVQSWAGALDDDGSCDEPKQVGGCGACTTDCDTPQVVELR
jgi:hypothetical protein